MMHKTGLFPEEMTRVPLIRIRQECSNCRVNLGKYKMTHSAEVACGLECYRRIFIGWFCLHCFVGYVGGLELFV